MSLLGAFGRLRREPNGEKTGLHRGDRVVPGDPCGEHSLPRRSHHLGREDPADSPRGAARANACDARLDEHFRVLRALNPSLSNGESYYVL